MQSHGSKRIAASVGLTVLLPALLCAQQDTAKPALVRVLVPAEAEVHFDQHLTKQTGSDRLFETPPLPSGKSYTYLLKATWPQGNRHVVRMAVATVHAGRQTLIDLRPGSKDATSSEIVYVPTPLHVVNKMLEMAKLTKDDIVFDLGCGDGRVVVTAAEKYGARGVGIDIDPQRVKEARANAKKAGVEALVEIRQADALKVPDLSKATVVMTYMLPEFMEKLKPLLEKELKPGTRVVAHDYAVPGWEPLERVNVPGGTRIYAHTLYLWRIGAR